MCKKCLNDESRVFLLPCGHQGGWNPCDDVFDSDSVVDDVEDFNLDDLPEPNL